MNTGHDGSITTVHANSPRDALSRIENMVMMAGFDLPIRAIREQIASAVNVIIQLSRLRDGSRRVTHITEVSGMEGQTITLQDIFVGQQTGVNEDGRIIYNLVPTGIRPTFMDKLAQQGLTMNIGTFARIGR
jgi:pilus assembly protein CpaF